jgi:4-amino-4-deoxy-L-arabinose transferase-like glycosyltransferase
MFRSSRFLLSAFGLIAFAILAYISLAVFQDYPFSMDEYNYLYQAKIFDTGRLYLEADSELRGLFETHMVFHSGKLFSKYPPGFSLLLLGGIKLAVPGLVNPLLSVGTLFLIYVFGAELVGRKFSFMAVILIAGNAYFLGYGASYFSQPASLFFTSLTFYLYHLYRKKGGRGFLFATGLAIAALTLIRPLDAAGLWIIVFIDLIATGRRRALGEFFSFCALSVVGAALLFIYNKVIVDAWSVAPYAVWHSDFKLFYGRAGEHLSTSRLIYDLLENYIIHLGKILFPLLTRYFIPPLICLLPLIILGFFGRGQQSAEFKHFRKILLGYGLLLVLLYNVHPSEGLGWPQYGARYWYPLVFVLGLLLSDGLRLFSALVSPKVFFSVLGILFLLQTWQSALQINDYSERFQRVREIQNDIERQCPPQSIVILGRSSLNYHETVAFLNWNDFRRNPFLSGARLFLISDSYTNLVQKFYPGYSVCHYFF